MTTETFQWVLLALLTIWSAAAITLWLSGSLNLNSRRDRAEAESRARDAVAQAGGDEDVALLLQVLSDLETDLETLVRHCDFEGDPDGLILEGWLEARSGFTGMAESLRAAKRLPILRQAGLVGPAMTAKATAYYYWRAMAGLDRFHEAETPEDRPGRQRYEDPGTGFGSFLYRKIKRNGPKALRVGDIVADSAVAALDIPFAKGLVAAADGMTGGLATTGVLAVKTAAHGASEMKKIVEEAKITRVHRKAKRAKAEGRARPAA